MSKEIKCPICQGVSTLRYNENRTYMSHCHDINCFELVTVTASSEAVAEELFSKFEQGMKQPKLSIPKKIAEELDELEFDWDMMVFQNISEGDYQELFDYIDRGNSPIIMTYLASKALGVELVEVSDE